MTRASLIHSCFLSFAITLASSPVFALQSGGVEIGDLETGSVIGTPFKKLDVDLEFTAMEIGGKTVWYPPTSILPLGREGTGARGGRPVLMKVTNGMSTDQGFELSADSAFAGPTSMHVKIELKPGETKYVGIPISDLTYVTTSNVLRYGNHLEKAAKGGQLLIFR
jgi:hypothetical protein